MDSQDGDRRRQTAGWSLVTLTLAPLVTIPISLAGGVMSRAGVVTPGPDLRVVPLVASFALSGGALIQLRPHNRIGWLLVVSGLLQVTNVAADATRPAR